MNVTVSFAGRFTRDLKRLAKNDQDDTILAIRKFSEHPKLASLNFEPVRSQKSYYTVRLNLAIRILLLKVEELKYEAMAVGRHDYIYGRYFRK